MSILKRLFVNVFETQSMSHTSILAAFFIAAAALTTCSTLLLLNRFDELERMSVDCDYYVETTLYWKESPTGPTVLRDLPYRNFDYAYNCATAEFNAQTSGAEAQYGLLDSLEVRLHSDCAYGHQVIWNEKFVCSEPSN